MIRRILVVLCLMPTFLGGCINMTPPAPETDFYTFEYPPPDIPHTITTPYILKIETFQVSPVYDDNRFLYRTEAFKLGALSHHRWRAYPGELLTDHLIRDFTHASFLHAVVTDGSIPAFTHLLTGTVEAFYERIEMNQRLAVLSVSVLLIDETSGAVDGSILFQHRYSFQEAFSEKTPAGFASAMSRAMQNFSKTLMEDVFVNLAGNK